MVTCDLSLVAWLVMSAVAQACPTCKEALFDPAQARQTMQAAKGYALSIGLLLGTMGLLIGGLTTAIVRSSRRLTGKAVEARLRTSEPDG